MKKVLIVLLLFVTCGFLQAAPNNGPVPAGVIPTGVAPIGVCYATPINGVPVLGPCAAASLQTTINCSTSGTAVFSEVSTNPNNKKVLVTLAACIGTATFTIPVPFTQQPSVFASNNLAVGIITANLVGSITVTGTTSTGTMFTEGY